MLTPERIERPIEDREILTTVHEQRATGVVHRLALAEIDVLQSVNDVEDTPDVHLEPEHTQEAPEQENVYSQT